MGDPGMGRRQSRVPRARLLELIRAYRLENAGLRARLDAALETLARVAAAAPVTVVVPASLGLEDEDQNRRSEP